MKLEAEWEKQLRAETELEAEQERLFGAKTELGAEWEKWLWTKIELGAEQEKHLWAEMTTDSLQSQLCSTFIREGELGVELSELKREGPESDCGLTIIAKEHDLATQEVSCHSWTEMDEAQSKQADSIIL